MLKYTSIYVNNVKSMLYCKGQKTISSAFGLISQQHMAGNIHVTPNGQGDWQVKRAGAERASAVFDTQAQAIKYGTNVAQNNQSEVFIHGRNGQIRERNTFGHDPVKSKG